MKRVVMAVTNDLRFDNRVRREADILVKNGYLVTVVGLTTGAGRQEVLSNGVQLQLVPISQVGPRQMWRYFRHMLFSGSPTQHEIFLALRKIPADIYHAHDLDTLLPVYRAARQHQAKLVYDSHELFIDTFNEYGDRRLGTTMYFWALKAYYRWFERRCIRQANAVITVNTPIAQELSRRYGARDILSLYNCPTYAVPPTDAKQALRARLQIPPTAKIALYQGGFGLGRGLRQLVEAADHLPADYYLLFVGNGSLRDLLQKQAARQNAAQRILFHPAEDPNDLIRTTAGADVGVMTIEDFNLSKRYATPNKLFEYMMAGVPIASSKLPVLEQIVGGEKIGLFFPSLEPHDIARTIVQVRESPDYDQMKARALSAAQERYNWSIESAKLVELYKNL